MGDPVVFAAAYLFAIGGVGFLLGCGLWALVRRREPPAFRDVLAEAGGPLPGHGEDAPADRLARLEREVAELRKVVGELQRNLATVSEDRRPATDDRIGALARELRRPRGEVQLMLNVRKLRAQ
ncbi:MAG: hypothetical protein XD69_0537 [Clostridia bacterium 62_21]|nr:MAG: hypothetical protein XD69_0537 [Clostridia bacterium 62_21]